MEYHEGTQARTPGGSETALDRVSPIARASGNAGPISAPFSHDGAVASQALRRPTAPVLNVQTILAMQRLLGNNAVRRVIERAERSRNQGDSKGEDDEPTSGEAVPKALQSPGQPFPLELAQRFSAVLGADLHDVNVHTGSDSSAAAKAVGARAFTVGKDIHFDEGQYSPHTAEGQRLLAHEAVHTVQQAGATNSSSELEVSNPTDPAELEAEGISASMMEGLSAPVPIRRKQVLATQTRGTVLRQEAPPASAEPAETTTPGVTPAQAPPGSAEPGQTATPGATPTQAPPTNPNAASGSLAHYRFEIKAWIPFPQVPDPEEVLHDLAFRLAHSDQRVDNYASQYRGDGHSGYEGRYRVFQIAEFDWDGVQVTNVTFPSIAHFGTSHRDFSAELTSLLTFPPRTSFIKDAESATVDHTVTHSLTGHQEIDLGMSSPNPLTISPAPDIDADYSFFISQDTFGIETVTVRWTTDFMPNHGFRVTRNDVVVMERIVNALPGPVSATEIFVRLNSKSNGGAVTFEPAGGSSS
jgi:hypothetical protein